jgi:hypothetical protein
MRFAVCTLALLTAVVPNRAQGQSRWIKARLGPFEAISDDGRRPATQALNQFAQFSFALGTAMGQPELRLDPPLRIIVYRNQQELAAQCSFAADAPGLRQGRDRLMACTTPEGRLPAAMLRELTRVMLENNFSRMPAPIEKAIETFFSTIQATGVHVTWGEPPPAAERTREWALLHRILTQQDLSGRAKIYLHNLAAGMDRVAASRNAFGEEGATFDADSERYFAAGVFHSATAPNRPLDPDRDFNTTALTSDEGQLMRADLLNSASPAIYQGLIKAGKQLAESYEGMAMLALRADNVAKAGQFIDAAREAGTKNFVVLTAYAAREPDTEKSVAILKEALTADPKYALAHWVYGEKLKEPARRMGEWKLATELAPRQYEWMAQYAALCVEQKQFAEAGRAWSSAAQSAPTEALRDEYLAAREQIESQRLEAEDAERRRIAEEKAREIERLKAEARSEVARIEARASANPLSKEEAAKVVDFADTSDAPVLAGTLTRVECTGTRLRLTVKDTAGKTQALLVPDTRDFEIKRGETLVCGAQAKPPRVKISYLPAKGVAQKDAVLGQAISLELEP